MGKGAFRLNESERESEVDTCYLYVVSKKHFASALAFVQCKGAVRRRLDLPIGSLLQHLLKFHRYYYRICRLRKPTFVR